LSPEACDVVEIGVKTGAMTAGTDASRQHRFPVAGEVLAVTRMHEPPPEPHPGSDELS
jgi:hypothetical protein